VRFARPFEEGWVDGYVLALAEQWFMIAVVSDRIRFDGFQCYRLSDVRRLRVPKPHAAFTKAALQKRRETRPRKPRVNLADLRLLLGSAGRAFPLVTIFRERIDPEICHIGRVSDVTKTRLSLLEIDPDACWDDEPTEYSLREITRVDFGGSYEDALHMVGGRPPA